MRFKKETLTQMYLHRKNKRHVFQWIKIISTNLELFVQIYIQTLPFFKVFAMATRILMELKIFEQL